MRQLHLHFFALCAAITAGCATQQPVPVKSSPAPQQQPDERCIALEKDFIGMNSQDMRRLFGLAQERYEGAMPCIGAAAKFRDAKTTSACEAMPLPYVLDRVQQGSPAQLAGLRDGDAVDAIGERPIRFPMDFDVAILGAQPGSFMPVRIIRGDRSFVGQVRIGAQFPGDGAKCSVLPIK
jgi:membrane-associated protease RseP (regulator of RpoE activity)